MKVPFPLSLRRILLSVQNFPRMNARKCTWTKQSLIIPCSADKRNFIKIYADAERRNGDCYEQF